MMKKVLKKIIKKMHSFRAFWWCLFHRTKYVPGLYIGRHVVKERNVKLILNKNCRICHDTLFWGNGTIEIGENSSIGSWSRIYSHKNGGVRIGNNSMSASHLYIIDSDHQTELDKLIVEQELISKPVIIGDDVWLGYHCTILKGVNLKNGCVVGACSLVTHSFDENCIIGGSPASVIKYRK